MELVVPLGSEDDVTEKLRCRKIRRRQGFFATTAGGNDENDG